MQPYHRWLWLSYQSYNPIRCRIVPTLENWRAPPMTHAITLKDITIHPVVEQQAPFFDAFEFFPTLTKELFEENRAWLEPTFIDPANGRVVLCVQLRDKDRAPQHPHRLLCRQ